MSIFDRFRLQHKVAVITGAGKGIGAGIARAFAEAGADVVIGARTKADLDQVAQDIAALGRRALVVPDGADGRSAAQSGQQAGVRRNQLPGRHLAQRAEDR